MATANKNLSDYDPSTVPDAKEMRFGIAVSEWNMEVTGNLLKGARQTLIDNGAEADNILVEWVPGSFELPLGARTLIGTGKVDAVICLGSVVRGETSHFDYVCQATALGIKDISLATGKPVIFGVLTDDTQQQALDRSGGKHGNKGDEAAIAAIKMVDLQKRLKQSTAKKVGF